jgi:hypothetical protein
LDQKSLRRVSFHSRSIWYSVLSYSLLQILEQGNEAQRWLMLIEQGHTIDAVVQKSIAEAAMQEAQLMDLLL